MRLFLYERWKYSSSIFSGAHQKFWNFVSLTVCERTIVHAPVKHFPAKCLDQSTVEVFFGPSIAFQASLFSQAHSGELILPNRILQDLSSQTQSLRSIFLLNSSSSGSYRRRLCSLPYHVPSSLLPDWLWCNFSRSTFIIFHERSDEPERHTRALPALGSIRNVDHVHVMI